MTSKTVRTLRSGTAEQSLVDRVRALNERGETRVIKTRARACTVTRDFVGHTLAVHNGRAFVPVYVIEPMVGHRLGDFAPAGLRTVKRSPFIGTISREQAREAVKAVMRRRSSLDLPGRV